jgi:hypothetical protein
MVSDDFYGSGLAIAEAKMAWYVPSKDHRYLQNVSK